MIKKAAPKKKATKSAVQVVTKTPKPKAATNKVAAKITKKVIMQLSPTEAAAIKKSRERSIQHEAIIDQYAKKKADELLLNFDLHKGRGSSSTEYFDTKFKEKAAELKERKIIAGSGEGIHVQYVGRVDRLGQNAKDIDLTSEKQPEIDNTLTGKLNKIQEEIQYIFEGINMIESVLIKLDERFVSDRVSETTKISKDVQINERASLIYDDLYNLKNRLYNIKYKLSDVL